MKYILIFIFLALLSGCNREPTTFPIVKYAGEMRHITDGRDSTSKIFLDTINPHQHLYGLGPLDGMSGEILIIDGRPYASKINRSRLNRIRQTYLIKSPYFVYTHVRGWNNAELPDITTIVDLEKNIEVLAVKAGIDVNKPFPFLIKGTFDKLTYRISYLNTKKKKYKNPVPETSFIDKDENAIVLGFFSKNHQGIFIPEGANIVMSFMTTDASQIGQIDHLHLTGKKVQLLLPR